jgi:hypothetical protein
MLCVVRYFLGSEVKPTIPPPDCPTQIDLRLELNPVVSLALPVRQFKPHTTELCGLLPTKKPNAGVDKELVLKALKKKA